MHTLLHPVNHCFTLMEQVALSTITITNNDLLVKTPSLL